MAITIMTINNKVIHIYYCNQTLQTWLQNLSDNLVAFGVLFGIYELMLTDKKLKISQGTLLSSSRPMQKVF